MRSEGIKKLIQGGETQNLEFTKDTVEVGKSLCAFANTNDGIILVGVSDKGEIKGCSPKEEQRIANTAHTCKPSIYPEIEKAGIDGRIIFIVRVKKSGSGVDYAYKNVVYKRVGTHDKPLSPGEVIEFAKDIGEIRFDSQVCEKASLDDIDKEKLGWYLDERAKKRGIEVPEIPFEQILINIGAAIRKDSKGVPTNAGILFFGKDPKKFIPDSELKIARFSGTSMVEFIDRAELRGTLPYLIDEAERFVRRNTRRATKIVGFRQVNVTEYPYEAIREAITNAVCHRDYFFSGATIRVMIFDDRIEVESPGKLPAGITLKTLEGSHILRNKVIGELLYDIEYIEKWGTGIRRMKDLMSQYDLLEPKFEEKGNFFRVTFYSPGDKILDLVKPEGEVDLKELGLNERQISALAMMVNENEMMTNNKYQGLFGVSRRTAVRDLNFLLSKNLIQRKGSKKGVYYESK